jgi:hypothetical protein
MYLAADKTAAERRADTPLGGLSSFFSTLTATALLSDQLTTRAPATRTKAVPLLAGGTDKRKRPQTT